MCEAPSFWSCPDCECVVWCLCSELRISLGVLRSVPTTLVGSRADLDQQIKWPNVPELWAGRKWLPLKALLPQPLSEQKPSFAQPLSKTLSYFPAAEITSVNSHLSYNRQIFTCHFFLQADPRFAFQRFFFPSSLNG